MKLIDIVFIALMARINVLLWGDPGVGKTSAFKAGARAHGLKVWPPAVAGERAFITLIASLRDPTDFGGLPILPRAGERGVHLEPPAWAIVASHAPCWVFLDELSTAPPATQAAALRVIAEGVVGEQALHPGCVFMAAANPIETAANGFELAAATANRWCHIEWEINATDVANGFTAGWPDPTVRPLPADWEKGIPAARALVAAFLRHAPGNVLKVPNDERNKGRAWPSPRTWDFTARALAACTAARAPETAFELLCRGLVGEGAAIEFLSWRRNQDLQDPEALLKNPALYRHPARADAAFATLEGVVAAALAERTPERWINAWRVLVKAAETQLDIAFAPSRVLVREAHEGRIPPPGEPVGRWNGGEGAVAVPRFALQCFQDFTDSARALEQQRIAR